MIATSIFHNSREISFRKPGGAVPCGSIVRLRLLASQVTRCMVRLWSEYTQPQERVLPMRQRGEGIYEIQLDVGNTPDILWYFFIIEDEQGQQYYGNAADGLGGCGMLSDEMPQSFQITVYDAGFQTPAWMQGAVMYQIFPDRFCKLGEVPGKDVYVYPDWSMPIDYAGDHQRIFNDKADYFGGTLEGIREKLPYLKELGVDIVYLNPIFEAQSNHRYNTADYMKIDPLLGDIEDFRALCERAKALDIHILLDGVFSHTGSDSIYFNRYGRYDSVGAYQSRNSPYFSWYQFHSFPNQYESWWGFDSLPAINKYDPSYQVFTLLGEDAVVKHWIREGASGWRLDVVDELPTDYVSKLRAAVKSVDADAAILGEVWEDASHKVAYSAMRPYVLGEELDSATNYPLRNALLAFMLLRISAADVQRIILSLKENYPPQVLLCMMNMTGTHDVPRLATTLLDHPLEGADQGDRGIRATCSAGELARARARLRAMAGLLFALPGMPSIYYGDETGMHGMADPYCREPYPWGKEDLSLVQDFKRLGRARARYGVLRTGDYRALYLCEDVFAFLRFYGPKDLVGNTVAPGYALVLCNRSETPRRCPLDFCGLSGVWEETYAGEQIYRFDKPQEEILVPPLTTMILVKQTENE